ncbi:MAG: ATP-binding protein [Nitrospirales bacterium]
MSHKFSTLLKCVHERTILILSILFGTCLIIMVVHISHLKTQMLQMAALTSADVYTRALTEMRSLYTSEVVERVRSNGVVVAHDYEQQSGAIPLPATLSQKLGERMGLQHSGEETRLFSPHPFPWNTHKGGLQDSFERQAWTFLNEHPEQVFFQFEDIHDHPRLRYATADIMRTECVDCHNAHPESPKRNWEEGQVRGVLEITYPIEGLKAFTGINLRNTYGMMSLLALLWLGGLGLVVSKLRRTSDELELRVQERTLDLQSTNQQLEEEIQERQLAEKALREARDYLELRVQERTAKLAEANAELVNEVTERKQAEEGVRKLNTDLLQQTALLEASNKELEAFSYSVSHDLRAPLRGIDGFSQAVLEDYGDKLDTAGKGFLERVRAASQRMSKLIDAMLHLARLTRAELHTKSVDLTALSNQVIEELRQVDPEHQVSWQVQEGLVTTADPNLLRVVLENLLGNAWKFTGHAAEACIEVGVTQYKEQSAFYIRDNGVGFDMTYVHKLFGTFQRLHAFSEFPGVGVGLATVQRIIQRHGGHIWAEGMVGGGATFYFTL